MRNKDNVHTVLEGEDQGRKETLLHELRVWLRAQHHLVQVRSDASFLLRFLRFQKFRMAETQSVLDKYVHMRTQHPDWFRRLDVRDQKIRDLLTSGYLFVLPGRDRNGRRVLFSRAAALDATRFSAVDVMRAHILTYETLLCDDGPQKDGLTYVFDERGVNWRHLSIWSPSEISKAFSCCERALPLRHQEIHFVHLPWTMHLVFHFAKSLLSQKLRERFYTHDTFECLSQSFPSHLLPAGYHGSGAVTQQEMIDLWLEELESKRDEVLALDEMHHGIKPTSGAKTKTSSLDREEEGVLEVVGSVRKMENSTSIAQTR